MSAIIAASQAYSKSQAKAAEKNAAEKELDIVESLRPQANKDTATQDRIDTLVENNNALRERLEL